jgi:hypothetical protein
MKSGEQQLDPVWGFALTRGGGGALRMALTSARQDAKERNAGRLESPAISPARLVQGD